MILKSLNIVLVILVLILFILFLLSEIEILSNIKGVENGLHILNDQIYENGVKTASEALLSERSRLEFELSIEKGRLKIESIKLFIFILLTLFFIKKRFFKKSNDKVK